MTATLSLFPCSAISSLGRPWFDLAFTILSEWLAVLLGLRLAFPAYLGQILELRGIPQRREVVILQQIVVSIPVSPVDGLSHEPEGQLFAPELAGEAVPEIEYLGGIATDLIAEFRDQIVGLG